MTAHQKSKILENEEIQLFLNSPADSDRHTNAIGPFTNKCQNNPEKIHMTRRSLIGNEEHY